MITYKVPPPKKHKVGESKSCIIEEYRPSTRLDVTKEMAQAVKVGKRGRLLVTGKIISVEVRESTDAKGGKRQTAEVCIQPDEISLVEAADKDIEDVLGTDEE